MKTAKEVGDGSKRIDRMATRGTGRAPKIFLMADLGIQIGDNVELYQHPDGYAIIIDRVKFEVGKYKNGKITVKKIDS